jgi:site-specific recombinase XerC
VQTPLAQQIDWYLDYLAARPASPRTIDAYRTGLGHMRRFAAVQGITSAEQLTEDLVRAAAVDLMRRGARRVARGDASSKGNEGAAKLLVVATRGLCRALARARGLQVPDLRSVQSPRIPERLQPRVLPEDFVSLDRTVQARRGTWRMTPFRIARDAALIQLLYETGLRAFEASRLDVQDIDLKHGVVNVRQGKGCKSRRIGITDPDQYDGGETLRRLRAYLQQRAHRPGASRQRALWLGVKGGRMSPRSIRAALGSLCADAGTDRLPVHAFRRGHFTVAYTEDPQDLPVLAARMGWSQGASSRMAAVYTRGALLDLAALPRRPITSLCLIRQARDR